MADNEKKIIIDEDWKAQAQKAKEELKQKESETSKTESEEAPVEYPPADFSGLVSMLATQAFYSLGVFRIDENDDREPNFQMAKFNIDMLGVIEEKSKGNLSKEESKMLQETLAQLRMAFVQFSKQD